MGPKKKKKREKKVRGVIAEQRVIGYIGSRKVAPPAPG